jgi:enoyl-CoA hydratase/carnithine racemase
MIVGNIKKAPLTAMVLVQHLRASEQLSLEDALVAESFAYATVQKGPDFLTWLAGYTPPADLQSASEQPLEIEIDGNTLALRFNDPATLNSIGIKMRDALANPDFSKITLTGKGRVFSTGGEIGEFGEVTDPATAHWVRSLRLPAWRMARLRDRLDIHVNGAAVGAGCEILGFASKITASPKAWFRLPELKYGLIPGAGGTASLPKRIGRQKTAFMALSMQKIRAQTALDWGLIDEIVS